MNSLSINNLPLVISCGLTIAWLSSCQPSRLDQKKAEAGSEEAETMTIFRREPVLEKAKAFFRIYCNDDPNPYFDEEFPPDVFFDLNADRFEIVFCTGLPGSDVSLVLNKEGTEANIIFDGGLALGDPPTENNRSESCPLYSTDSFRGLAGKYFKNGLLSKKVE